MLVTMMTGLAIWTTVSVGLALVAGRVITFHERVEELLPPLSETVRGYLSPGPHVPIRQT